MEWTPRIVSGLLVDQIRRHYSSPEAITNPLLRDKIWTNSETTGILIEEIFNWKPQNSEKRPAIIIKRNGCQRQPKYTFGDLSQGGRYNNYASGWHGSHTLYCIATSGAEAEMLAADVALELLHFASLYWKRLFFQRMDIAEISEITKLEEAQEHFTVYVTAEYDYTQTWQLHQAALRSTGALSIGYIKRDI